MRDGIDAAWDLSRKFGLDPFPTHFELVPASIMYEFASYTLPGRYSHWTFGKAFYRQKMQYDLGLSKIYEMVVNTNPSYAFLMEMNNLLQNTFVAAHVFGHTDFFKNNIYFQHTSRRMIDKVSIHAERIAKYEFDHGRDEVERFLYAVLSIQKHVDYNLLLREQDDEKDKKDKKSRTKPSSAYEDLWGLDQKEKKAQEERDQRPGKPPKFPKKPEKDILLLTVAMLLNYNLGSATFSRLYAWKCCTLCLRCKQKLEIRDGHLSGIRVSCVGWDSGIISDFDFVEFAQLHSSVLTPSRTSLNPYYIGYKILEDIEKRWDIRLKKSRSSLDANLAWDARSSSRCVKWRMMSHSWRNYLTEDLVKDLDLYLYKKEGDDWVVAEKNWQKVRDTIVTNMTNFGYPYLVVDNGDYRGNRELYIKHLYEGQDLDLNYAEKTLQHVYVLWGRPVHLETLYENKRILLTYDGERNSKSTLEK